MVVLVGEERLVPGTLIELAGRTVHALHGVEIAEGDVGWTKANDWAVLLK